MDNYGTHKTALDPDAGWPSARASTCTSRPPTARGSIWSSAGSPNSPNKQIRRGVHRSVARTGSRHPRLHRRPQRRSQALRLDQDRRPDPRQHRSLRSAHPRCSPRCNLSREPLGQDTRGLSDNKTPRTRRQPLVDELREGHPARWGPIPGTSQSRPRLCVPGRGWVGYKVTERFSRSVTLVPNLKPVPGMGRSELDTRGTTDTYVTTYSKRGSATRPGVENRSANGPFGFQCVRSRGCLTNGEHESFAQPYDGRDHRQTHGMVGSGSEKRSLLKYNDIYTAAHNVSRS